MDASSIPPALSSGSPALFKRMIAQSLARWRREAGLTQKDGAERLDSSKQHISNLESGSRLPTVSDMEVLLDFYGKPDRIEFMRELRTAAKQAKNWWTELSGPVPEGFDMFLGLESGARTLSSFDSVVVPGLLQTREYAEAAIRGNSDLTDEQVAQRVDIRLGRQHILDRADDPVRLSTVLDESVLYRGRGGAAVLREQLAHLLKMSEHPTVDIHVLPFDADATPAAEGGTFTVLKFPPAVEADPGLVYVELLTGGKCFEGADEIAQYDRGLTALHALAADQRRSRGIIKKAMKEAT